MQVLDFDIAFPLDGQELSAAATMPTGKILALSGPSGKGKTSLLMALAGMVPDIRGRITCAGQDWMCLAPHQRQIGFAFQDDRLFQHMSIRENLDWIARRAERALPNDARQQVLQVLDLADIQDRKASVLSGGERRRAGVARAITQNPDWLFLDEPFAGLDEKRAAALASLLEARMATRQQEGWPLSILFVSHDGRDIARLADQVYCLGDDGLVIRTPDDVADHTALRGVVSALDHDYALTTITAEGLDWQLAGLHGPVGRHVGLTIDARDIALSPHRPEGVSVRNLIEAEIVEIRQDATQPWAMVLLLAGSLSLTARITRKSASEMQLETGQRLFALVKSVALDHLI